MNNYNLREHSIHGNAQVPVGIYDKIYEVNAISLCPLYWCKEIEFFYVTKGGLKVQIDEKVCTIYTGEGAIINSASLRSLLPIPDEECGYIAITIQPDLFFDSKNETIMNKYIRPMMQNQFTFDNFLSPTTEWMAEVLDLINKTYDHEKQMGFGHELFVKSNILKILGLCLEHATYLNIPVNNNKIALVKHAITYIHNNYKIDFSLGDMAEAVHVSREYLCKIFKEVAGYPMVTFLNRYRVLKSLEQLDIADIKISEVALESGFNHISYYNKVFLELLGCSPTEYRNKNTERHEKLKV